MLRKRVRENCMSAHSRNRHEERVLHEKIQGIHQQVFDYQEQSHREYRETLDGIKSGRRITGWIPIKIDPDLEAECSRKVENEIKKRISRPWTYTLNETTYNAKYKQIQLTSGPGAFTRLSHSAKTTGFAGSKPSRTVSARVRPTIVIEDDDCDGSYPVTTRDERKFIGDDNLHSRESDTSPVQSMSSVAPTPEPSGSPTQIDKSGSTISNVQSHTQEPPANPKQAAKSTSTTCNAQSDSNRPKTAVAKMSRRPKTAPPCGNSNCHRISETECGDNSFASDNEVRGVRAETGAVEQCGNASNSLEQSHEVTLCEEDRYVSIYGNPVNKDVNRPKNVKFVPLSRPHSSIIPHDYVKPFNPEASERPQTTMGMRWKSEENTIMAGKNSSEDTVLFKGFKLRDYVKPQERYRNDPFIVKRREKLIMKLAESGQFHLDISDEMKLKMAVAFPKAARMKQMENLVDENAARTQQAKFENNGEALQLRINRFIQNVSQFCKISDKEKHIFEY